MEELSEILNDEELQRLTELEAVIESDLPAFVRVAQAFIEVHDRRLYRSKYSSFREYLDDRWPQISHVHAYRLIKANATLEILGPTEIEPRSEYQIRPLGELPEEQRAEAWAKACELARGNPSGEIVQSVVDEMLGKSKDIQPEEKQEGLREEYPDDFEGIREEEWLDSLPLSQILEGIQLKRFHRDALLYRRTSKERGRWRNSLNSNVARENVQGSYTRAITAPLKIQPPEHWLLCPQSTGCGGLGLMEDGSRCKKCRGAGFWFNGYRED